jgi:hypothetical protein
MRGRTLFGFIAVLFLLAIAAALFGTGTIKLPALPTVVATEPPVSLPEETLAPPTEPTAVPTSTPVPPTNTPIPPTATPVPTNTPVPTPIPPTPTVPPPPAWQVVPGFGNFFLSWERWGVEVIDGTTARFPSSGGMTTWYWAEGEWLTWEGDFAVAFSPSASMLKDVGSTAIYVMSPNKGDIFFQIFFSGSKGEQVTCATGCQLYLGVGLEGGDFVTLAEMIPWSGDKLELRLEGLSGKEGEVISVLDGNGAVIVPPTAFPFRLFPADDNRVHVEFQVFSSLGWFGVSGWEFRAPQDGNLHW